jgi:uncharacterized protein YcaQ
VDTLSLPTARRLALAAQGLADGRPAGRVDVRHVRRALSRAGVVQIDSVNVLARAHELTLFSRLGPYPKDMLGRLAYRDKELFEYWGHEASFVPMALHPMLRWRMARAATFAWAGVVRIQRERPDLVARVRSEVAERGPVTAAELGLGPRGSSTWWGWSEAKTVLEWLFWSGEVAAAGRRRTFERVYDLTERVIPAAVLDRPTPAEPDAHRALLRFAAARLGVATASDLADYWRLKAPDVRPRLAELVEDGELVPVRVDGWSEPAYLDPTALRPRRPAAAALLSPCDSLLWRRPRVERLFGMRIRLEIYTPAAKRVHGYYVLPFLLGEHLVARLDLKSDRRNGILRVEAAHLEPPPAGPGHPPLAADPAEIAGPLAAELSSMARWLGLQEVLVADRGSLAPPLQATAANLASG